MRTADLPTLRHVATLFIRVMLGLSLVSGSVWLATKSRPAPRSLRVCHVIELPQSKVP